MKKIFLTFTLFILLSFALAQNEELVVETHESETPPENETSENDTSTTTTDEKVIPPIIENPPIEIILHELPDFLRVSGLAKAEAENEQVKIGLTIETLKLSAGDSLSLNSLSSTRAIANIRLLGLDTSEFATSGISIYPSYRQDYHYENRTYTQVFEGYKVRNTITISTKKIDLAGKIIDAAVSSGVNNVDYITFSPIDSTIAALKEQLLAVATNNASRQANIVLDAVGYEIKSVKSLNIVNTNYYYRPPYDYAFASKAEGVSSDSSTQTFQGSSTVNVQVDVAFIIGKKEISSE